MKASFPRQRNDSQISHLKSTCIAVRGRESILIAKERHTTTENKTRNSNSALSSSDDRQSGSFEVGVDIAHRLPGPVESVCLSSDNRRSFRLELDIRIPLELMFAALLMGMCPPPRMANRVCVWTRRFTASESCFALAGAKMHAGFSHALEDQETVVGKVRSWVDNLEGYCYG